ncbi:MAG: thiamine pyrophosphate-dependent enzyme [Terracidiphilus sp.]|jgi:pyruvate dehydrogenase E1 component alpha subunit
MTAKSNQQPSAAPVQPAQSGFSLISNDKLLQLYSTMLKCRSLAERSPIPLKPGKLTGRHSSILGREAAAVGVAIDLLPEDTIAPANRDRALLNAINPSVTLAAGLHHATRAAQANKDNKNNKIAVVLSTGNSASLPSWQKALNLAAAHNLPTLFISLHPLKPQPPALEWPTRFEDIPLKTKDYAFPAITVDGNDAVAVYRVASEAIAHARKGHGPTLIVCRRWKTGDPLLNMEKYLIRKGLFTEDCKRQVAALSPGLHAAQE